MNNVYGSLARFDPPAKDFGPLPENEKPPEPTTGSRRRRFGTSCDALTVDGSHIGPFGWTQHKEMRAALNIAVNTTRSHSAIRCAHRGEEQIAPTYAMDVCLTSSCRACPFLRVPEPEPVRPEPLSLAELRLRDIRRMQIAGDYTNKDLADMTGLSAASIVEAIRGRGDAFVVQRLADVLGVAW